MNTTLQVYMSEYRQNTRVISPHVLEYKTHTHIAQSQTSNGWRRSAYIISADYLELPYFISFILQHEAQTNICLGDNTRLHQFPLARSFYHRAFSPCRFIAITQQQNDYKLARAMQVSKVCHKVHSDKILQISLTRQALKNKN